VLLGEVVSFDFSASLKVASSVESAFITLAIGLSSDTLLNFMLSVGILALSTGCFLDNC
jgi:hypothetical protein